MSSWGLSYNLYADKLLKLNLFPASIYSMRKYSLVAIKDLLIVSLETAWYKTVARMFDLSSFPPYLPGSNTDSVEPFGVPLDTR